MAGGGRIPKHGESDAVRARTYLLADSHLMELSEWWPQYADAAIRDRIRPLYLGGAGHSL
jgi:hypothetical protein